MQFLASRQLYQVNLLLFVQSTLQNARQQSRVLGPTSMRKFLPAEDSVITNCFDYKKQS